MKHGSRTVGSFYPSLCHTLSFLYLFNTGIETSVFQVATVRKVPAWTKGTDGGFVQLPELVNVSFLGRGGVSENVKEENESPHRIFINLTHGLLAQIEAGNCGNSNHVTRAVCYHKITNLLRRQYNLHISSPISNCLTLICCWKEAHSRRGS
jgi:hypothetical protein